MYIKVNLSMFRDEFHHIRPNSFSYDGLEVLFDYLEDLDFCSDENCELDVIALCCDFAEGDALEIANDYKIELGDEAVCPENVQTIVREYLENEGVFVGETSTGSIVYHQF